MISGFILCLYLFSFEKLFKFLRIPYLLKLREPQSAADY